MPYYDKLHNEFKQSQQKKSSHVCVVPQCTERAIMSHTISKSLLKSQSDDNNYYWLNKKKMVGIKELFVFPTFCSKHDSEIFKKIDAYGNYVVGDAEYHNLLYFRCLANEMIRLRNKCDFLCKNNYATDGADLIMSTHLVNQEIENLNWIENSFFQIYADIENKCFNNLITEVIEIDEEIPVFIGQYFDMTHDFAGKPIKKSQHGIVLSSFQQVGKTYILLSFRKEDIGIYKFLLDTLQCHDEIQCKTQIISTLALIHCQNIGFDNQYWDLLGKTNMQYRNAIEKLYSSFSATNTIDIFVSVIELNKLI